MRLQSITPYHNHRLAPKYHRMVNNRTKVGNKNTTEFSVPFFLIIVNSISDDTIDNEFVVVTLDLIFLFGLINLFRLIFLSSLIMFVRIIGVLIIVVMSQFTIISGFCSSYVEIRLISPLSRFNANESSILLGYDSCCFCNIGRFPGVVSSGSVPMYRLEMVFH